MFIFTYPKLPVYSKEEFEDTKGVIRICKSKYDRHNNGQKNKDKL